MTHFFPPIPNSPVDSCERQCLTSNEGDVRTLPEHVAVLGARFSALGAACSYPVLFVWGTLARPRGWVELVVTGALAAFSRV